MRRLLLVAEIAVHGKTEPDCGKADRHRLVGAEGAAKVEVALGRNAAPAHGKAHRRRHCRQWLRLGRCPPAACGREK